MFAESFISEGSLILSDRPLLTTEIITDVKDVANHMNKLRDSVSKLEPKKKRQLFGLHNARPDLQLLGLFGSNSISLPLTANKSEQLSLSNKPRAAVFPTISRINHSCEPNVVWSWNDQRNCEELRAVIDIPPGTEMTASYVDVLLTSTDRREELSYKYDFICQCRLCTLPSKQIEILDDKRTEINRLQREVREMKEQTETKDAYLKTLEALKLGLDLGLEAFTLLPQLYLDCYQLCCKLHGTHSENKEAVEFYDRGLQWATKLRGENTVFSKIHQPNVQ